MTSLRRGLLLTAGVTLLASVLSGCSTTVSMQPATDANSPDCAAVIVRLPDRVASQPRQWTDAQGTAAWDSVLLTCGVTVPGPSELPCQPVDGVDWLVDDSQAPYYRFTTYGRDPAVEVYLDYDEVSGNDVLVSLATAVDTLPQTGSRCTDRPQ